jgi:hypothetical protein
MNPDHHSYRIFVMFRVTWKIWWPTEKASAITMHHRPALENTTHKLRHYSPALHYNLSMKWNCPFFSRREVKISQPFSVTNSVCSNWADNIPSTVTAVHLSGHISSRQLPVSTEQNTRWDNRQNYDTWKFLSHKKLHYSKHKNEYFIQKIFRNTVNTWRWNMVVDQRGINYTAVCTYITLR